MSLYWFGPPKSKTLRPVLRFVLLGDYVMVSGSPRPPYIDQRMRSVPRLLASYDQETYVYVTHLAISRRFALVEIHRCLVLFAKSCGRAELGRLGNLLEGLQKVVWAANQVG
jgi:hypothetical protein